MRARLAMKDDANRGGRWNQTTDVNERPSKVTNLLKGVVVLIEAILFIAAIAFVFLACWAWNGYWGPNWLLLLFAVVTAFFGMVLDLLRRMIAAQRTRTFPKST
jgi:hypothetical protein